MLRTARVLATAAVVALGLGGAALPSTAAGAGNATVSVLHAIPGPTVDVYANGNELHPRLHARHPDRPPAAAGR